MRKHKFLILTILLGIALTAGAATLDRLAGGSVPTGAQQPLCSTSTIAASFQAPGACGLAVSSNSPANLQPLCGTGVGTAAYETPVACGLAISSNAPGAVGQLLCGTNVGAASYTTPALCFNATPFSVPAIVASSTLTIGSGGSAIANSKTTTVAVSASIGPGACTNFCAALNSGAGYLIASCPALPGALIASGYMDGSTNGCARICNVSSTATTPVAVTCYLREFQ